MWLNFTQIIGLTKSFATRSTKIKKNDYQTNKTS